MMVKQHQMWVANEQIMANNLVMMQLKLEWQKMAQ